MPINTVLESEGLDIEKAFNALREAGFKVPNDVKTISDLSRANHVNPRVIYTTMFEGGKK
ncbi:hypothetical protein RsTz2092_10580 [Deferribacterales bacterium RsTz2092]